MAVVFRKVSVVGLVVPIVAAIALGCTSGPGATGPSGASGVSGSPGAGQITPSLPAVGPTDAPNPTVTPTAASIPLDWTNLTVTALAAPRPLPADLVRWSGGDIAVGSDTPDTGTDTPVGPTRVWSSPDGRSWTELPLTTFGFDDPTGNTFFSSGAACGNGVLIETVDANQHYALYSSTDGTTWTRSALPNLGNGTLVGHDGVVVADTETPLGGTSAPALAVSTDCTSWQRVGLPGPKAGSVLDIAANATGFVAVGYSGRSESGTTQPLAWYSTDGLHWSAATVPASRGNGFALAWAGSSGYLALSDNPGLTPGTERLWSSTDGHAWAVTKADPFGLVTHGEGEGSPAGSFTGDGKRLLAYGRPETSAADDSLGTYQYYVSSDGLHWTHLTVGGADGPAMVADTYPKPFLLADGIVFAGATTTWFGAP
jgi:hypothetical protein